MKEVLCEESIPIPSGVTIKINSRIITVTGPHGTIVKDFRHLPIEIVVEDEKLTARMWLCTNKRKACLRTLCSRISNMFKGVLNKFQYKMRLVYSHFPININIIENGTVVEIRHFLGEGRTRVVKLSDDVICEKSSTVKDELILIGIDIDKVSRSCALLRQNALVRNKDIRQFLDGIYVSEKGLVSAAN
uniref:Large ribosomal subunit protein uL6 n=1 Tax=Dermatophagoides pteronyssinus TaxID=6956 RepID=A0A6P6Y9U6_DERPT|nr:60S ribosomal protein L9-A-like [Dermatophagoides pteronyssinus]